MLRYIAAVVVDRSNTVTDPWFGDDVSPAGIPAESEIRDALRTCVEDALRVLKSLWAVSSDVYRELDANFDDQSPFNSRESMILGRRLQYLKIISLEDVEDI